MLETVLLHFVRASLTLFLPFAFKVTVCFGFYTSKHGFVLFCS